MIAAALASGSSSACSAAPPQSRPQCGNTGCSGSGSGGAGGGTAGFGGTGNSGGFGGSAAAGGGGSGSGAVSGASGSGGFAGTGGAGGSTQVDSGRGCDATTLLPVPLDVGVRGPWAVGVRTVTIGRLTVEVIYPAEPGSTDGLPEATYDVRDWLPPQEQSKVPDANSPAVGPIGGNLFRDVPIDAQHGPYPVVIFIHGTASFRIASGTVNVHWASRGFVVVAADYPGLFLADQLNAACGYTQTGAQDIPGDVNAQLNALQNPSGDLGFLGGHVDMTRLAISGHSQGGCVSATLTTIPNVKTVIPMSGSAPTTAATGLQSILYVSGINDTVIGYSAPLIGNVVCPLGSTSTTGAYQASPGPPNVTKRLAGIAGGGHLVPTDLCQTNQLGRNAVQEAQADGVCGVNNAVIIGLPALFDCGTIDMATGLHAVSYASTAALEETLLCKDRSAQFASLQANVPAITEFQHVP